MVWHYICATHRQFAAIWKIRAKVRWLTVALTSAKLKCLAAAQLRSVVAVKRSLIKIKDTVLPYNNKLVYVIKPLQVQYGINLHKCVFKRIKIVWARLGWMQFELFKTHKCKLIPYWKSIRFDYMMIIYASIFVIETSAFWLAFSFEIVIAQSYKFLHRITM